MRAVLAHNFSELLQRPVQARVDSHVYMAQSAGPVFDDHEYLEHADSAYQSQNKEAYLIKSRPTEIDVLPELTLA